MNESSEKKWLESSNGLEKTFSFRGFMDALAFVVEIGVLAEAANHHPDIDLRWNQVHLRLVTHDAGNQITEKDRRLAKSIDHVSLAQVTERKVHLF
jgi:4a-hydroxytetrahydrobiopterin dehydratase